MSQWGSDGAELPAAHGALPSPFSPSFSNPLLPRGSRSNLPISPALWNAFSFLSCRDQPLIFKFPEPDTIHYSPMVFLTLLALALGLVNSDYVQSVIYTSTSTCTGAVIATSTYLPSGCGLINSTGLYAAVSCSTGNLTLFTSSTCTGAPSGTLELSSLFPSQGCVITGGSNAQNTTCVVSSTPYTPPPSTMGQNVSTYFVPNNFTCPAQSPAPSISTA